MISIPWWGLSLIVGGMYLAGIIRGFMYKRCDDD